MNNVTLTEIRIWPLFLGSLDTGERIGLCHACGRKIRTADAGHTGNMAVAAEIILTRCTECAEFWPLPAPAAATAGRAVCQHTRPLPCPCGQNCFLCGGELPSVAPTA